MKNDHDFESNERLVRAMQISLAGRVRVMRMRLSLSGAELARRAGVTRAMLSKIESGERMPSLTVLVALARALGVDAGDLMGRTSTIARPVLVHADSHSAVTLEDESMRGSFTVLGQIESPGMQIRLERIRIEELNMAARPIEFEGFWIDHVISGEVRMSVGDEEFHLRPGDTLTYRSDMSHALLELPKGPVEVISVMGVPAHSPANAGHGFVPILPRSRPEHD